MTLKEQHTTEAQQLSYGLYRLEQQREAILKRLRELEVILATLDAKEKEKENGLVE